MKQKLLFRGKLTEKLEYFWFELAYHSSISSHGMNKKALKLIFKLEIYYELKP